MIKGCDIFWGSKIAKRFSVLWAGILSFNKKKSCEQNAAG